jgi:dienelactone hydrolase
VRAALRIVTDTLITALLAGSFVFLTAAPAGASACSAEAQRAWDVSCDVAYVDSGLVIEDVAYTVDGLTVHGKVCRPLVPDPAGSPVLVVNHSAGVGAASEKYACNTYPRYPGYVVLLPEYRAVGEDPPNDDWCLGEVDDVIGMVDRARSLSYVDDTRIVMRGMSLGGCVTLRAQQRGVPGLQAAAVVNPATDAAGIWTHANSQFSTNLCLLLPGSNPKCPQWRRLRNAITTAVGGPPGPATEAAYDERSPLRFAAATASSTAPLLIVQGGTDDMVPTWQTCAFVQAVDGLSPPAKAFQAIRFGAGESGFPIDASAPPGCGGLGRWLPVTPAPTFPADRYLVVLDGLEHFGPTLDNGVATTTADLFLFQKNQ